MGAWSDNLGSPIPRILIADGSPVVREPLAASLRAAGYATETAADGPTALAIARGFRPDLILLEISLPIMDGLEFLARWRREPRGGDAPVILLTSVANRDTVRRAAELGVKDYLLKSRFSLTDLLTRVDKLIGIRKRAATTVRATGAAMARRAAESHGTVPAIAPRSAPAPSLNEEWPTLLTREQCLQRAERAMEGRALSGVVSDVISLAGSPRGDLSDLADLIGRDAMLTARVLQAANSAAFAGARKMVTTLSDAVRQIGATNVRNTAMTLGVFEAMPTAEGGDVNPIRAWQHSFAVATICRTLAEAADKGIDPGVSYLAGLCHDLGMVLFRTEFASEYAAVMQRKAQSSRPLPQIERHMLGMTQADLSQLILKKLGLPAAICAPIGEFHAQASRPDRPALQPLARLLRVANLYADGVLLAESPASEISPITKLECREGIGTDDMPPIDGAVMRGQIFAMTAMLARLPPGQTAPLMRPLIEPAGKRILLVREPAFSTLDPVAAALESLGEFRVVSEFGNMADAGECDAIIVESLHRSPLPMNLTAPILRLSKAHEESSQREGAPAGGGVIEAGPAISLQHLAGFLTQIKVAQSAAA